VACLCLLAFVGFGIASRGRTSNPAKDPAAVVRRGAAIESLPAAAPDTETPITNAQPTGSAGRKIFVDPVTGKLIPPPAQPALVLPQTEDALSTSGEGLREIPGKTRGGGIKIDLQGRFRSTVTATVNPDGKLTTRCLTEPEPPSSGASR